MMNCDVNTGSTDYQWSEAMVEQLNKVLDIVLGKSSTIKQLEITTTDGRVMSFGRFDPTLYPVSTSELEEIGENLLD